MPSSDCRDDFAKIFAPDEGFRFLFISTRKCLTTAQRSASERKPPRLSRRLDLALLFEAEHDGEDLGIDRQPDDVSKLIDKFRVA
jgi:hypothetical protein